MDVEPSRGSPSQAPALFLNVSYCQPMTGAGAAGVGGPGEAVSQALGRRILEVLGWGPRMLQGPSCRGSGPLDGTHVTRLWRPSGWRANTGRGWRSESCFKVSAILAAWPWPALKFSEL